MNIFHILKRHNLVRLVHRDLGDKNILVNKDNVWLLDFQISVVCDPAFEAVNTLIGQWYDQKFTQAFLRSKIIKDIVNDEEAFTAYKFFSIYAALFDLAITKDLDIKSLKNYFEYAVNLKR